MTRPGIEPRCPGPLANTLSTRPLNRFIQKEYRIWMIVHWPRWRCQHFSYRVSGLSSMNNTPVHNSILVTDYLTKMGIKTVPHSPNSPDLAPCDFWLLPKLRGCRYETIEEMKEAVTKVINTLTKEDFNEAFQKLLEQYNKCTAARGDYFEGDKAFMCVLSIKVPIRKISGNLSYAPRIYI